MPTGLLQLLPPMTHPFEEVNMDLVTSLQKTQHGHDTVFTVVDQFSKLVPFVLCVTSSTAIDIA